MDHHINACPRVHAHSTAGIRITRTAGAVPIDTPGGGPGAQRIIRGRFPGLVLASARCCCCLTSSLACRLAVFRVAAEEIESELRLRPGSAKAYRNLRSTALTPEERRGRS